MPILSFPRLALFPTFIGRYILETAVINGPVLLLGQRTTADTVVGNTAAETTILTLDIPGGTLRTNGRINTVVYGSVDSDGSPSITFRFSFGGSTYVTSAVIPGNATDRSLMCIMDLIGAGSNTSTTMWTTIEGQDVTRALAYANNATVDTSATQELKITVQWSVGSAARIYTADYAETFVLLPT